MNLNGALVLLCLGLMCAGAVAADGAAQEDKKQPPKGDAKPPKVDRKPTAPTVAFTQLGAFESRVYSWRVVNTRSVRLMYVEVNSTQTVKFKTHFIRNIRNRWFTGTASVMFQNNDASSGLLLNNTRLRVQVSTDGATMEVPLWCGDDQVVLRKKGSVVCKASFSLPEQPFIPVTVEAKATAGGVDISSPPGSIDFVNVQLGKVSGECAKVSDTFQSQEAMFYAVPVSIEGEKAPSTTQEAAEAAAVAKASAAASWEAAPGLRLCEPKNFTYSATYHFEGDICGTMMSYSTAMVSNQYSESTSSVPILFSVTGCRTPDKPLPVIRLPIDTVEPINATGSYAWTVTRKASKTNSLSMNFNKTSKVDITTTFKRTAKAAKTKGYFVSGGLVLANPHPHQITVARVLVHLAESTQKPVTLNVSCPGMDASGAITLAPRGSAYVNCTWAGAYPGKRARPSVVGAIAVMPDGRVIGSNLRAFNFSAAPDRFTGECAMVSDTWSFGAPAANVTAPEVLGEKVPDTPITICDTTTFKAAAQFGAFVPRKCGKHAFQSRVTVAPLLGAGAAKAASTKLDVVVTGCPK